MSRLFFFYAILLLAFNGLIGAQIFPAPKGVDSSNYYSATIDGEDAFVYATHRQDRTASEKIGGTKVSPLAFCMFDFDKDARVVLKVKKGVIENAKESLVRPIASGIKPEIDTSNPEFDKVSISLSKPGDYTFDPRGNGYCAIHIFSNLPETDIPSRDDPSVLYYGAGVHEIESLKLKSGQTLYIEGGGILLCKPKNVRGGRTQNGVEFKNMEAPISVENGENITIRGRGIISCAGSIQRGEKMPIFRLRGLRNFTMRDIVLLEAGEWNVPMYGVEDSLIDGIKIVAFYVNSDGICPAGNCKNIRVKNCFIHNADDGYEIKSMGSFWGREVKESERNLMGPVSDIVFEDSQVWCDLGSPMGLTHEIDNAVENIVFRNITILNHTPKSGPYPARAHISLFPAGGGKVSNILFENIVQERADSDYKINIVINNFHGDSWKKSVPRYESLPHSKVENVVFKNVDFQNVESGRVGLYNHGGAGDITGIVFDNVKINGKKLERADVDSLNAEFNVK